MFPQSQKIPDLSVTQNSRLLVGLSHFWISIAPLQVCFSTPKSGFWLLLLSLISGSIKGQEVLIKTHKKCFVICTVITQSSLELTTQDVKNLNSLGLQALNALTAQRHKTQLTCKMLRSAEQLMSWGKRCCCISKNQAQHPYWTCSLLFLSSLGCTKCQKDRKWRFFTVWELNFYWCKDWSWTSTKRWNHSLFQRGKGLVCFQYNLKPITLSNACILWDGKRTLDDPYVIFLSPLNRKAVTLSYLLVKLWKNAH